MGDKLHSHCGLTKMNSVSAMFIGTGNSECLNFYNTNMLISRNAKHLLIDCGWTAKEALLNQRLSIRDIDAIFITHIHGDHVFGLERFGFESRYVHNHRIKLFVTRDVLYPLWNECLMGCMGYSSDGKNDIGSFFEIIQIDDSFSWQGLDFKVFPTTHTVGKPSYGIRLAGCFTFTSDTKAIPDLDKITQDDPYVFHDLCLAVDHHPAHATIPELIQSYPPELLKRIYAVHYEDDIMNHIHKLKNFAGWVKQGEIFRW
ncbi:MAG: MBL fold metallo-hydrolase [Methanobacteriota archaeon]|nr:MAG: MBL fold metallo-hydrolase [Euryarchaeota archaeon]